MSCWNATVFKSCLLHFQIFNAIGQVLLQFSKFLHSTVYHFLSLVELERWLAEMRSFPHQHRRRHSSTQDTSGQGYSPDPSSRGQRGLGSRLDLVKGVAYKTLTLISTHKFCSWQLKSLPPPPWPAATWELKYLPKLNTPQPLVSDACPNTKFSSSHG